MSKSSKCKICGKEEYILGEGPFCEGHMDGEIFSYAPEFTDEGTTFQMYGSPIFIGKKPEIDKIGNCLEEQPVQMLPIDPNKPATITFPKPLEGKDLDEMATLMGCERIGIESDDHLRFRIKNKLRGNDYEYETVPQADPNDYGEPFNLDTIRNVSESMKRFRIQQTIDFIANDLRQHLEVKFCNQTMGYKIREELVEEINSQIQRYIDLGWLKTE